MKKVLSIVITILIIVSSLTISQFSSYATDKEALTVQQKAQNLLSNYNYKSWKKCDKVQNIIVENGEKQGVYFFDKKVLDFTSLTKIYDTDSLKKLTQPKYYYQMVILDLLNNKSTTEEKIKNAQELFDNNYIDTEKFVNDVLSLKLDDKMSLIGGDKKSDLKGRLKKYCNVSDRVFDIIDVADTVGEFIKSALQLSSLENISLSMEEILYDIGASAEKQGNSALKSATDDIINKIIIAKNDNLIISSEIYLDEISETLMYKFADELASEILNKLGIPGKTISISYKAGKLVGNVLESGDEQCSTYLYMRALYQIEKLLLSNMETYENDINSYYSSDRMISSFEFFNSIQICGLDMAEKYVKLFHEKVLFFKISDECYNTYMNSINFSRNYIKNTNFYSSDLAEDVEYGKLDICFVVDTTGSMEDDIDNVKENMEEIIESLSVKTNDFRVSLVDYRDFCTRTGYDVDYPYDVKLKFTNDINKIKESVYNLSLGNGGDELETVYSGIMAAIDNDKIGNWRNDATKIIVVMGDAGALDPEPYTDYTYSQIINSLNNGFILNDEYDVITDKKVKNLVGSKNSDIKACTISIGENEEVNDLFSNIAKDTNGIYTNVLSASEVSMSIINMIEKIDIENPLGVPMPFNVVADFGQRYANENLTIALGENISIKSVVNENGVVFLDGLNPGVYKCVLNDDIYSMIVDEYGIATVNINSEELPSTSIETETTIAPTKPTQKETFNPTISTDFTSKVSTNDTATNDSINNDNGTIQTGAISIAVIIFLILASLATGGFVWYRRKIK